MLIAPGLALTHYAPSAPLGERSNPVLYGHDDIEGGVFAHLDRLRAGDLIDVQLVSGATYEYSVDRAPFAVQPDDVSAFQPTPQPRLTLFTCYPLRVDTQRLVVVASLRSAR